MLVDEELEDRCRRRLFEAFDFFDDPAEEERDGAFPLPPIGPKRLRLSAMASGMGGKDHVAESEDA